MQKLKSCVIGCGMIAEIHVCNFANRTMQNFKRNEI